MYWEEVYEFYEYASNLNVIEKNEQFKFQFLLHAGSKKAIDSWKDMQIPYPDREWKPKKKKAAPLPLKIQRVVQAVKMTDERRERFEYVKKRLEEGKKKALEDQHKYYQ